MPRRGDNIHKRSDGRWEGRYIKRRDENGKAFYASVYGKSYSEVKTKLSNAINNNSYDFETSGMLFSDVLFEWLETNRIVTKDATYSKYEYMIKKYIVVGIGNYNIDKLTSKNVNEFIIKMQTSGGRNNNGLSDSYVRTMAVIINCALNYAVNSGYRCPLNNKITKPGSNKSIPVYLSDAEYRKLVGFVIENCNSTGLGVLLGCFAGLRIGEVCALRWENIDFKMRTIIVDSTVSRKGNKYFVDTPKTPSSRRIIPIHDELLKQLKKQKPFKGFVISHSDEFVNPRTFEYRYHALLKSAEVKNYNFHALRHTFATKCIDAGMDVKTLSEILGHSNCSVTLNTYVHSSLEKKKRQINMLTVNNGQ